MPYCLHDAIYFYISLYNAISGIPQREYFEALAQFSDNEDEQEKLIELSSGEGTDLFYDYCIKEKRNYIEVLEDFRSCCVPLEKVQESA